MASLRLSSSAIPFCMLALRSSSKEVRIDPAPARPAVPEASSSGRADGIGTPFDAASHKDMAAMNSARERRPSESWSDNCQIWASVG